MDPKPLKIGILAGEISGDHLGSSLMRDFNAISGDQREFEFIGVGGPQMIDAGLKPLASIDQFLVNGFLEPLLKLPELWALYKKLLDDFDSRKIDLFIGIDFNVFNFLIEKRLKKKGIRIVHYVSPSVYAWRKGRAKKIGKFVDLLLCLFPFEPGFYKNTDLNAVYVGHPKASAIDIDKSDLVRGRSRERLGLPMSSTVLAVLPGSRKSEIHLLFRVFIESAIAFSKRTTTPVVVVIPCANTRAKEEIELMKNAFPSIDIRLYEQELSSVLYASDIVLTKAGTSTLDCLLHRRPMVVSYKLGRFSYFFARFLVDTRFVALPNIISGKELVPELLQDDATAESLSEALLKELKKSKAVEGYFSDFEEIHRQLATGASRPNFAASEIVKFLNL